MQNVNKNYTNKIFLHRYACHICDILQLLWCISGIIDICLQAVFITFKEEWSSETLFWIWNIKGFAGNEGLLIFIPLALSVPTECENSSRIGFYIHKPLILVPRRPIWQEALSKPPKQIFVQQYDGEPALLKKKQGHYDLQKEIHLQESKRDNTLPKKELPLTETQTKEIILSIPNLCQENAFPSILYCKVHQSYRMVR